MKEDRTDRTASNDRAKAGVGKARGVYDNSAADLAANVAQVSCGSPRFSMTSMRRTTGCGVASSNLVEFRFPLGIPTPTRTTVQVALIPETGSPVNADFKTPATYGTDTTITLR